MSCGGNVLGMLEKLLLGSGLEWNELGKSGGKLVRKSEPGTRLFRLCRHGESFRLHFRYAKETLEGGEQINNFKRSH